MGKLKGFTLIEVALFLAITGALFVAVTVGVQNSISQQRYNDSVQNFAEFLRNLYSEVTNVENTETTGGRSESAIYGKLVTFGESKDPSGNDINVDGTKNNIYVYNVVGEIGDGISGSAIESLKNRNADVVLPGEIKTAGNIESYTPRWSSKIESTEGSTLFSGALLIIRHPISGIVYTYVKNDGTIEVNKSIADMKFNNDRTPVLQPLLGDGGSFKIEQVDFCVNPEGSAPNNRSDVRVTVGARNASNVNIVPSDDDEDNKCRN